jgi:hypothetical protein
MSAETITCPKCGHENSTSVTNCENCRINLAWAIQHMEGEGHTQPQIEEGTKISAQSEEVLTKYETVVGDPDQTKAQDAVLTQRGDVFLAPKRSQFPVHEKAVATLTDTALLVESLLRLQRKVFLHIPLKNIVSVETAKRPDYVLGPPTCVKTVWQRETDESDTRYWFLFEPAQVLRSGEPARKLAAAIQQQIDRLGVESVDA